MQQQLPLATLNFSAQAKKGADHTINKLYLSKEWRGQSDLIIIHAVHANRTLLTQIVAICASYVCMLQRMKPAPPLRGGVDL